MPQRTTLDLLIRNSDETYASISSLIGRNPAYIQQFIKRGTPSSLRQSDLEKIADRFCVSIDLFDCAICQEDRMRKLAAGFAQRALDLCDLAGFNEAACHIQYGLDIIMGAKPLTASSTH